MDQEDAKKNKISIEERIDDLVCRDIALPILHQDQSRMDFIRFLYMDMHSNAGQDAIGRIELVMELLCPLERYDHGLVNLVNLILEEKLASVKAAYDSGSVNKEFMFWVRKAVDTWKSKDERKDFNYDEYIKLAEARISDT